MRDEERQKKDGGKGGVGEENWGRGGAGDEENCMREEGRERESKRDKIRRIVGQRKREVYCLLHCDLDCSSEQLY